MSARSSAASTVAILGKCACAECLTALRESGDRRKINIFSDGNKPMLVTCCLWNEL